ncbi:hypothetical protein HZA33_03190 [Candidatus Pacearchaeota archaeon]|nr:hypothetical protein [Candidatus Pacearchaeota archaeon]
MENIEREKLYLILGIFFILLFLFHIYFGFFASESNSITRVLKYLLGDFFFIVLCAYPILAIIFGALAEKKYKLLSIVLIILGFLSELGVWVYGILAAMIG